MINRVDDPRAAAAAAASQPAWPAPTTMTSKSNFKVVCVSKKLVVDGRWGSPVGLAGRSVAGLGLGLTVGC